MSVSVAEISARDLVGHYAAVRRRLMGKAPSNVVAFPKQKTNPEPTSSQISMVWRWTTGFSGNVRPAMSAIYEPQPSYYLSTGRKPSPPPPVAYKPVLIGDIQTAVCLYYGVEKNDLLSSRKAAPIVFARQVCCYLAKRLTARSYPDIGRFMGGRDHTTVLYATRKITAMAQANHSLSTELALLEHKIKNREA